MPFLVLSGAYSLAAIVVVALFVQMSGRTIAPSEFVVTPPRAVPAVPGAVRATYLQPPSDGVAHAVTAIELADGRIVAYWFAGSREGAGDVVLRSSILADDAWSAPRTVVDRQSMGAEQRRFIKTIGNPVILRHPGGEYWLITVSVTLGGWSGSALNLMRSADGITWGPPVRLVTGPFLNLSTLVKGPALVRADGLVALPAYHEFASAYPELLLIDGDGRVVDKIRMGGRCQIQPWAVALDPRRAVALMRAYGCTERRLWVTATEDAGATWDLPRATLANPDSPAAAVALPGGRIAAVLNDDPASAKTLDLVISDDGGETWRHGAPVFGGAEQDETYRYPWLLQDSDGRLHVFATESQRGIRHAVLGAEALATTPGAAP